MEHIQTVEIQDPIYEKTYTAKVASKVAEAPPS